MTTAPLLSFRVPAPASSLPVSLDRLIESRLLIQANSGGGKSRAIRYLLEQTHGKVQHIVLDREGEFATLRDRFAYALAGPGGETAADVRSAKLLARRTLEVGFSLIIDLSEMSLPSQRQYVKAFLDSINHLPRELWKDCLIVIDEAHLFAPESGKGDGTALEAIALLLSTGRKRGYCAVLATQRIAKLSKDVAAECLNKMIGRTSEEDVKRAAEEIGMSRADAKSLRALDPGQFWSYGPAIGIDPVLARTGDVQTAPPKRGALREPAPPTPDAIKRILADLADLPAEAAHEEEDRATLRKRIAALEREAAKKPVAAGREDVALAVSNARGLWAKETDRAIAAAVKSHQSRNARIARHVRVLEDAVRALHETVDGIEQDVTAGERATTQTEQYNAPAPEIHRAARQSVAPRAPAVSHEGVSASEQRILNALALMESLGAPMERINLAFFAGYTVAGRFNNLVGGLRTKGLVEYPRDGEVTLSDDGRVVASADAHAVRSLDDLHALWLAKLPASEEKVLRVLLNTYPSAMTREQLAAETDYTVAGRFNNLVGKLRTLGAIEYPVQGQVRASDVLFPNGLR